MLILTPSVKSVEKYLLKFTTISGSRVLTYRKLHDHVAGI